MTKNCFIIILGLIFFSFGCDNSNKQTINNCNPTDSTIMKDLEFKVNNFASYKLTTDLSVLTEKERQMLPFLFKAAQMMDEIHWLQAFGQKDTFLTKLTDANAIKFFEINYGPWERLNGNKSFLACFGDKPAGANFYPVDMSKEEFEALADTAKKSQYTIIRRKEDKTLEVIPYHVAYKEKTDIAVENILKAAELCEDEGLKKYLELRAKALQTDDYFASDMAWMEMKTNTIDFICGPIENYEDALFGIKTAHEAFILIKDKEWSKKLEKFASLLPELQKQLPVKPEYKKETPGTNSDLNAYDAIFYAGDCNSGSKTIAINLPNDERVQLSKGSRRLQLKNSMKAKFENILNPISQSVMYAEQQQNIKFEAFFSNVMFHEVAHGLGIKNTITKKGTTRESLKETYSTLEEAKADILGLWLVTKLSEMKQYEGNLMDNYTTFMAGIFRSIRFGAASAHGKANLIEYNYFRDNGAFTLDENGICKIDFEKMKKAVAGLADLLITIQGNGDYEGAKKLIADKCLIDEHLQKNLDKIKAANIPVDVVWEQGPEVLGIK